MKSQTLNGSWKYRIGKGEFTDITVPFSRLAVGHFECLKVFDLEEKSDKIFLNFHGITYSAKVYLNGEFLGSMLPYCEYKLDVTKVAKQRDNLLLLEMEDTAPAFGPTAGWENYGGIIRDVELLFLDNTYIEDVFFSSTLKNGYLDADFKVETRANGGNGTFHIELFEGGEIVADYFQSATEKSISKSLKNVKLWSPDTPNLYDLKVSLVVDENVVDTYNCKVGFREFICSKHHFLLNGEPFFIKGVCKHEMFGDSGHCPSVEQTRFDMQMIKNSGCNFVRLVHYPHNKRVLEIADELGLMVSEEPGLWWSDTANPEVKQGSLEVLRRTILRDRNHPSIVFWLSFNECRFTEEYLVESAKICRKYDPTRLVSGANCMSDEDTLKYYNICGFDFYTMHPYSQTIERAKDSARILNDKPLLFTEWGGHFVYDNPKLLSEFMGEMYSLFENPSEEGALAGAIFWQWSELNDYNRGGAATVDGELREGLVSKYRAPNLIYPYFCDALKKMGKKASADFWIEGDNIPDFNNIINENGDYKPLKDIADFITERDKSNNMLLRRRNIEKCPVLKGVEGFLDIPFVLEDEQELEFNCSLKTNKICLLGLVSFKGGYPLGGDYGEEVAEMSVCYSDGTADLFVLKNGVDVTTVFETNLSSKINPIAEKSPRLFSFGYNKNFERYVLNHQFFDVDEAKKIEKISFISKNNGYALLIYGIAC